MPLLLALNLLANQSSSDIPTVPGDTYSFDVSAVATVESKNTAGSYVPIYIVTPFQPASDGAPRLGYCRVNSTMIRVTAGPLPITGSVYSMSTSTAAGLTDGQLRAVPVPIAQVGDVPNSAQAHQVVTPTSTASLFSALGFTLDASTKKCLIQGDGTGAFRLTLNGTPPTTTVGFLVTLGNYVSLSRAEMQAAQVIAASGAPVIQISASL